MVKLLLLVVVLVAIALAVMATVIGLRNVVLARRIKASDSPLLYLSRKERREYARELLKREQERYELKHQDELLDLILGSNPVAVLPPKKGKGN